MLGARQAPFIERSSSQYGTNRAGLKPPRLLFRSSPAGPNAFALPSGVIVMTDQMVEFSESDEELVGVIAARRPDITIHLKERTTGPEGMAPFVRKVVQAVVLDGA